MGIDHISQQGHLVLLSKFVKAYKSKRSDTLSFRLPKVRPLCASKKQEVFDGIEKWYTVTDGQEFLSDLAKALNLIGIAGKGFVAPGYGADAFRENDVCIGAGEYLPSDSQWGVFEFHENEGPCWYDDNEFSYNQPYLGFQGAALYDQNWPFGEQPITDSHILLCELLDVATIPTLSWVCVWP